MVATERSFELRLLVALLAVIAFFTFWVIPVSVEDPENFGYADGLAPSFSVYLVAALAAITLAWRLFRVLKTVPEQPALENAIPNASDEQSDEQLNELAGPSSRSWAIIGACLAFSFLLIPYIGFYISSFAFIIFLAIIMGERRGMVLTSLPILLTAAIYAGFEMGFTIFLPRGELILHLFDTLGY